MPSFGHRVVRKTDNHQTRPAQEDESADAALELWPRLRCPRRPGLPRTQGAEDVDQHVTADEVQNEPGNAEHKAEVVVSLNHVPPEAGRCSTTRNPLVPELQ